MNKTQDFLELQKMCQRSFPDRLDQHLAQIGKPAGERYLERSLQLSWREGRRPRVERLDLRRYADPWTWWRVDDEDKAAREWQMMRWLYGQGLPVPRPYAGGDGFVLLARAPGQGHPAAEESDGAWVLPHLDAFARLLARLHRLVPPAGVRDVLPAVALQEALRRVEQLAAWCGESGLQEAVAELAGVEVEVCPLCVLRGEAIFIRAQCDARGITALSTWDQSALGDPRWDVARAALWLRVHDAEAAAERFCDAYAGYGAAPVGDTSFWIAAAAAQGWALASWVRVQKEQGALAQEQLAAAEKVIGQREMWIEQTWRALTRFRYENTSVQVS